MGKGKNKKHREKKYVRDGNVNKSAKMGTGASNKSSGVSASKGSSKDARNISDFKVEKDALDADISKQHGSEGSSRRTSHDASPETCLKAKGKNKKHLKRNNSQNGNMNKSADMDPDVIFVPNERSGPSSSKRTTRDVHNTRDFNVEKDTSDTDTSKPHGSRSSSYRTSQKEIEFLGSGRDSFEYPKGKRYGNKKYSRDGNVSKSADWTDGASESRRMTRDFHNTSDCNVRLDTSGADTSKPLAFHGDLHKKSLAEAPNPAGPVNKKAMSNQQKNQNYCKDHKSDHGLDLERSKNQLLDGRTRTENYSVNSFWTSTKSVNRSSEAGNNSEKSLEDFYKYLQTNLKYIKVEEIMLDLFELPIQYSLAHCVAEDFAMGSGIAVQFRQNFKRVDELYAQRQTQGGLAVLKIDNRFIYYLVTKRISTGKPTLETLFKSLIKMRTHVIEHQVQHLAMPRIGCGLDRLQWTTVKPMLEYVFDGTNVKITICTMPSEPEMSHLPSVPINRGCWVTNVHYPLVDIEEGTIIIYFGYENGFVSTEMLLLNNKFYFLDDYERRKRDIGNIITSYSHNNSFVLCGCIIQNNNQEKFNWINFTECVTALNKWNKKRGNSYEYVGIQAILDEDDDLFMSKIVLTLRYELQYVEIYVCGSDLLQHRNPETRTDAR